VKVNTITKFGSAMRFRRIPEETVRRLPLYLRGARLLSQEGVERASSNKLAALLGVNPWQIPQGFLLLWRLRHARRRV
jgi:NADH/NAD ratio-sensing transcriptional regulator Rex